MDRTEFQLSHLVTEWDRKQAAQAAKAKRGYYNPYALAIYLGRAQDVAAEVAKGADLRTAIIAAFNDRLRDFILKGMGLETTRAR